MSEAYKEYCKLKFNVTLLSIVGGDMKELRAGCYDLALKMTQEERENAVQFCDYLRSVKNTFEFDRYFRNFESLKYFEMLPHQRQSQIERAALKPL